MRTFFLKVLAMSLLAAPVTKAETVTVRLDLKNQGEDINPFIYGQFIEHLGRSIYGGIWAEMLEDRKFYFPITENYAPYVNLKDTDYPVVGASPWEILSDAALVTMVKKDSFVGEHTPLLKKGAAIGQHDLGVVSGKEYTGYIWLKSKSKGKAKVEVSLGFGNGKTASKAISVFSGDYKKIGFNFKALESSNKATLKIKILEGDVFVGTVSLMPKDNIHGMRRDTIRLLKELNAPLYRWPGGNFTSGYEWRDGIGDRDRRPPRKNPAWTGVEHNDFGTDEFIAFCREVNAEPMIAVNTGFGDAHSAAEWVEYCNSGADTTGGSYRITNGHRKPFNVKYWCVGNEMFGNWQLGFMQLKHYTIKHNIVARTMWEVDPDLILVGVGDINTINEAYDPDSKQRKRTWSRGMLEECANWMNLLSEHLYVGRVPWSKDGRKPPLEHVPMVKNTIRARVEAHKKLQASIDSLNGRFIAITMDEWNYWHRDYVYGELGCRYDLQDALGIAMGLHEFYRQSKYIHAANYAQTVNVIGAIKTTKTHAEFASTGLVLKLYRNHFGSKPLKFMGEIRNLDIMAALNESNDTLTLSLVNPTDKKITLFIEGVRLPSRATQYVITGKKDSSYNAPGKQRGVDIYDLGKVSIENGLNADPISINLWEIGIQVEDTSGSELAHWSFDTYQEGALPEGLTVASGAWAAATVDGAPSGRGVLAQTAKRKSPDFNVVFQEQRVALARALVMRPSAVLFDEPLANLDFVLKGEMLALMNTLLNQHRTAAIYVTHDPRRPLTSRIESLFWSRAGWSMREVRMRFRRSRTHPSRRVPSRSSSGRGRDAEDRRDPTHP